MIKEFYEVLVCKLFTNFNKGYNVLPLFIFDMLILERVSTPCIPIHHSTSFEISCIMFKLTPRNWFLDSHSSNCYTSPNLNL
jgi:hypothetical protein